MRSVVIAFPEDRPLPLWRADQVDSAAGATQEVLPTGYPALDLELPGGGWPATGLIELLQAAPGGGELRLLAPALATGHAATRAPLAASPSLLWIAAPFTPYAPALAPLGLAVERLAIVAPGTAADAAWAAEQALRSGTLSAVLWWQGVAPVSLATLRRLHLAAAEGRTPLFALRPAAARSQSSPAPLRLALEPAGSQLAIEVFKRRGPPMAAPLRLALPGPMVLHGPRRVSRPPPTPADADVVVRAAPERAAA